MYQENRSLPAVMTRPERLRYARESVDRSLFIREAITDPMQVFRAEIGFAAGVKITPETWSTISETQLVLEMVHLARVEDGDTVFELGTGTGYSSAILSEMVGPTGRVVTVERDEELAQKASERLFRFGYKNVDVVAGDGTRGFVGAAPYDAVILTAALAGVPSDLRDQLKEGGRFVAPMIINENSQEQRLRAGTRVGERIGIHKEIPNIAFVQVISERGYGWTSQQLRVAIGEMTRGATS